MYLKRAFVENNGPIRQFSLELPFRADGTPKPVILVGGNGSGKTNLISIGADALFEAAAAHYQDVTPGLSGARRPWFRMLGATTITLGAAGGCAILEFEHEGENFLFWEKAGNLSASEVAGRLPEALRSAAAWVDQGNVKQCSISDDQAMKVFAGGVYAYLPSSRAELPHWLNRESLPRDEFDLTPRVANRLRKPIYVERSLEQLTQWVLSVMIDARAEVAYGPDHKDESPSFIALNDLPTVLAQKSVIESLNSVLRAIFDDDSVGVGWAGRHASGRLVVHGKHGLVAPSLNALSAGQTTLLSIFGTLLRYGDAVGQTPPSPEQITGICFVDEIDAHMHIELQHRVLPTLIKMFPRVQFIVSSHSPLFALGMEKTFGNDGATIIEMPMGLPIHAEAYAEFEHALQVLQETKAFDRALLAAAGTPGKLLVFLEGETDPKYLIAAAELLGRSILLNEVEFAWVGAKDPKSGQGFHTGKDALNHTLNVLRAKPDLTKRTVLLLYDNDANKIPEDYNGVHVRSMPTNHGNDVVEVGVENLLPEEVITPDMFTEKTTRKRNGDRTTSVKLNKMKLCVALCDEKRNPNNFSNFAAVLDLVDEVRRLAQVITPNARVNS